MRVFVTGTGRCASVTFSHACKHITNFGNGHETVSQSLEYPDQHIEINPQFRCCIPALIHRYPDAKWVHLQRKREECVPSLEALNRGQVVECYRVLHNSVVGPSVSEAALAMYEHETFTIDALLKGLLPKDQQLKIWVHEAKKQWLEFWKWIGAEGDYQLSKREWDVRRNTRKDRGEI